MQQFIYYYNTEYYNCSYFS